jgi:hypothetical protein
MITTAAFTGGSIPPAIDEGSLDMTQPPPAGLSPEELAEWLECEAEHSEDLQEVAYREAQIESGSAD